MFDEEGLLARIGESPDDDLCRLVYADWLEENDFGDVAAFVRAQCRFARLPKSDKARAPLRRKIAELLPDVDIHWQRVLGDDVRLTRIARGLPEAVRWKVWPEPGRVDELLRRMPSIREIHPGYDSTGFSPEAVREAEWLVQIERLDLSGTIRPEIVLEAFSRSERPHRLLALDLSSSFPGRPFYEYHSDIFPEGREELRLVRLPIAAGELYRTMRNRSGTLERLHFSIGRDSRPLDPFAFLTVSGVGASTLEVQHIQLSDCTDPGSERVGEIEVGERCTHLEVDGVGSGSLLFQRLTVPQENRLRWLSLASRRTPANQLEAFFAQPTLGSLCELGLEGALTYPYDIQILLRSPVYARLNELNLANNALADEWMKDVLRYAPPEGLTLIDLRYNKIGRSMQAALEDHFGPDICIFGK